MTEIWAVLLAYALGVLSGTFRSLWRWFNEGSDQDFKSFAYRSPRERLAARLGMGRRD